MEHLNVPSVALLQELKSSICNSDEVERILLLLFDSFKDEEDPALLTEIVTVVLGSAIPVLPLEEIDDVLIKPFMPLVKQHLCKILSSIHTVLNMDFSQDSMVPQLTKSLEICVQVLSDVESLVTYLNNANQMSITQVFHLPKNVTEIVSQVFIHCQRSKDEYKEAFPAMRSQLMNLFQKCYKLQLSLFTLLNEKVVFNCTFENELSLLIEVLDIFGSMAEIVADLDTLSLVAHWKGYAQLTQTYATQLRPRLEVAGSIKYLSVNISHQLCSLKNLNNGDKKVILKSLKISSLQLKVLIKLCEHYKGYLGECHQDLLNCIVTLAAHTGQYLRQQGFTEEITSQITAHISAGAAPLLTHLINDPCFIKEYFQRAGSLQSSALTDKLGYCHLTNLMLKKLIQLSSKDQDVQELSEMPTLSLIDTVFKIIKQCSADGEIFLIQESDIYEALVTHSAAFIVVTCTHDAFPRLEEMLMKHLLQPYLWPALFSSDLFCLIGRLGTSELCFQLTCLFHEVLSSWPPYDRQRPEWVFVNWIQNRLISLLSSDHLQMFRSQFPPISTLASDISSLLNLPVSDKSVSLFQSVVNRLSVFGETTGSLIAPNQTVAEALYQMWQHMSVPLEVTSAESSHWFVELYSVLLTATCKCINLFNSSQIINILNILLKVCGQKVTMFHCGACEFLMCLANKTFDTASEENQFCSKAAALFVKLIDNTNPITKQIALETFSYFAYVVKNPQVIAETVSSNPQLQTELIGFIEGVPAGSSVKSVNEYLNCFGQCFIHKCVKIVHIKSKADDTELNPSKKLKTCLPEEPISNAIQRIEQELCSVEKYSRSTVLNKSDTICLRNICNRINKIIRTPDM